MKFGIIKERKNPPDRRVVFSPNEIKTIQEQFPVVSFKVEPSDIRIFSDAEYQNLGIEVTDDLSDCEVLFGVKEVPVEALIPNKKYFFFPKIYVKLGNNEYQEISLKDCPKGIKDYIKAKIEE